MKKIIPIVLAMLLMVQTVFAETKIPEALTGIYTNYTADYSISMTFDSSEEIVALLEELEMPEEVSYFVDMKALLKTLLSYDGKMNLQADISDNYDKIQMALTSESLHNIDVNPNLNVGVTAKLGMWMNMDLSDAENPVFDVIYSHPFLNKYLKFNSADVLEPEAMDMFKAIFNKEYIEKINKASMDMFAKYAKIEGSGNTYTITMDNEGLTAYIDELMIYVAGLVSVLSDGEVYMTELPSVKGWKILGEDGIRCTLTVQDGKIVAEEGKEDIAIDIAQIYTEMTGEAWEYTQTGKIDFTVTETTNISKIGQTKVEFPVLTEENSITMEDLEPEYEYEYEQEPEYPSWYVGGYSTVLPIIDGEIYVPLRQTLETAYLDAIAIDYANGVVTATSEYFPGFGTLTLTIGTDKAYAGDTEYVVGDVFLLDDTTYVNSKLFADIFGWGFSYADHNLLTDDYYYSFSTRTYY